MSEKIKVQKELARELNTQKILSAAEKVFANYGFKGATTERIAQQAGLPKANLHYYFKTKSLLYQELLEGILEEWMEHAKAFDEFDEPKTALTHYISAKMQFSRSRPDASKIWANEVIQGAEVVSDFLGSTLKDWLENRVAVINTWILSGKICKVDANTLMFMIWSVTQHYADFERQIVILNHGKKFSDEEYLERTNEVIQLILRSVRLIK